MTKNEIIDQLAKEKKIETIIGNVVRGGHTKEDLQDLTNDLYLDLLTKPEEQITNLYASNQLQYFITRMVLNSIYSTHSRYYYDYKRYNNNKISDNPEDGTTEETD